MPHFGVYPIADVLPAGEEISSTYEGRHVTLLESELIHPSHTDGLVNKGDPVVFGTVALQGVGVSFKSAAAATDLIAIDTEGIWVIDVNAADDGGNRAIEGGDRLYINNSTAIVSAIATGATQVPFGYALGHVDSGLTETIAVKVHWDPVDNWILDKEPFYCGDGRDCNLKWDTGIIGAGETLLLTNAAVPASSSALQILASGVAGTQDVGIAAYFDATAKGQSTANWTYAAGIWLNLDATFIASAGGWGGHEQIAALSLGVYSPVNANIADADIIYGVKAEGIYSTQTHGCYFACLNVLLAAPATRTARFFACNTQVVGFGATKSGAACGSIVLVDINGTMYYVNTFTS